MISENGYQSPVHLLVGFWYPSGHVPCYALDSSIPTRSWYIIFLALFQWFRLPISHQRLGGNKSDELVSMDENSCSHLERNYFNIMFCIPDTAGAD